jgi:aconitate hydratase
MIPFGRDSLKVFRTLRSGGMDYGYYSLREAAANIGRLDHLPISIKILLENQLRFEDGVTVSVDHLRALSGSMADATDYEIQFRPARILSQDLAGVPMIVDLAAMREAVVELGGDAQHVNPMLPVDLVVDHSVIVDHHGSVDSLSKNMKLELQRNGERFELLRWAQRSFKNFRLVPPGRGICHQVNLEYLARVVWTDIAPSGAHLAYPDTVLGTDSHTTMVNALGVLGWGVGGIEAEAAMLRQPIAMTIPQVVGVRLMGRLPANSNATDLVLTLTQLLRRKGVVGKFVEFHGPGMHSLTIEDRATIANMAPDYGATCGFFPVGPATLDFLTLSGRDATLVDLVESYTKLQGLWVDSSTPEPEFADTLVLDLATVQPCIAGPRRPQDLIPLAQAAAAFRKEFPATAPNPRSSPPDAAPPTLADGAVVIAAITSCTNTSNPSVLIAAGLLAANAHGLGLTCKPWVKTSFAPGSRVVTGYLARAGLQQHLDALGFNVVGYGCTTCIGNSGPLAPDIAQAIATRELASVAVLSGNRNFEGRVHPHVKAAFLASPPLVVAYAIAGTVAIDLTTEPIGFAQDGRPVLLRDIWPSAAEVAQWVKDNVSPEIFREHYEHVFGDHEGWDMIPVRSSATFPWAHGSTYISRPPFFDRMRNCAAPQVDIRGARVLAVVGDSFTTDHISPAGAIGMHSPAGLYLTAHGVAESDFNSYGARRGHHEVMTRGTLANPRLRNELIFPKEGGFTVFAPDGTIMPIFDAAMGYQTTATPMVVVGGKDFGTGSSRDWAAKGLKLLGVKAVLAESFERIHRTNLVAMGVLPLQFEQGVGRSDLGLTGQEVLDIDGFESMAPGCRMSITIIRSNGRRHSLSAIVRIDTRREAEYFRAGGVMPYVLRELVA